MSMKRRLIFLLQRGQSAIEALLALALLGAVITAITVAVTTSLSNTQFSRNQHIATNYAKEGTEVLRLLRDSDYQAFATLNGEYCLAKNSTQLEFPAQTECKERPNLDDLYIRRVRVLQNACGTSNNLTEVTVTVTWKSPRCRDANNPFCHSSEVVSCLSDVIPI